jgi:tRNA (mo5U34)-methyltransferase
LLLRPMPVQPAQERYGCRMASARGVVDAKRRALIEEIETLGPWFHNYEIACDIWTNPSTPPGVDYPLSRWRLIEPLLPDVKGKSCLDVGCSSGFFSLKLKELGAAYVLGVDSGEQPRAIEQARFAASTLGLDVDFRILSAYDLASLDRKFDLVLFMGVFYHLRHPLVALEGVRAVCGGTIIFQTVTTGHQRRFSENEHRPMANVGLCSGVIAGRQFPAMHFVEGALDNDTSCWFVPNLQGVAAILRSCGFTLDHVTFTTDHDVIVRGH